MLQQTRVAAVLEHYRVFLERFPDVEALARAPLDDVLAAWSGLGYYRRARMLHACAKEIVEKRGGEFPRTSAALRDLPGIGRYTAAAIASIAFDEAAAVVDGNVERVVQRLAGRGMSQAEIWRAAQSTLSPRRSGDFNQAMMELGATVCLPRGPQCADCPIRKWCAGKAVEGTVLVFDEKPAKRQIRKEIWCTLDRRDGCVRLVQRPPESSLMAGMWELPLSGQKPRGARDAARCPTFRHSITVTDYTVHVLRRRSDGHGKLVAIDEIRRLPLTGLARKILRAVGII